MTLSFLGDMYGQRISHLVLTTFFFLSCPRFTRLAFQILKVALKFSYVFYVRWFLELNFFLWFHPFLVFFNLIWSSYFWIETISSRRFGKLSHKAHIDQNIIVSIFFLKGVVFHFFFKAFGLFWIGLHDMFLVCFYMINLSWFASYKIITISWPKSE